MAVGLGLTAGFDVVVPGDLPVSPYVGAVCGAWIANYHSLGGDTQVLLDPSQNDLDDPGNVDPYTTQVTWLTGCTLVWKSRSVIQSLQTLKLDTSCHTLERNRLIRRGTIRLKA